MNLLLNDNAADGGNTYVMTQPVAENRVRFACMEFVLFLHELGNRIDVGGRSACYTFASHTFTHVRQFPSIEWGTGNCKLNRHWSALTCWTRQAKDTRCLRLFFFINSARILSYQVAVVKVSWDSTIKWIVKLIVYAKIVHFFSVFVCFECFFFLTRLALSKPKP